MKEMTDTLCATNGHKKLPKDAQWIEKYLNSLRSQNKSAHTLKNYRSDIYLFLRWYRSHSARALHHIQGGDIENYTRYLSALEAIEVKASWYQHIWKKIIFWRSKNRSTLYPRSQAMAVASKRRHLSSLKNFFEYLKQSSENGHGPFRYNPVRPKLHAIGLRDKDVVHTKTLTKEHFEKLQEVIVKIEDRLAVALLYYGALRVEELSRLSYDQFHGPSKTLRFIRKGGDMHTLKLPSYEKIDQLLCAHQLRQGLKSQYIFSNNKGQPLSTRTHYNRLMKLFVKAQLPLGLSPHSFRKGRATQLYAETKDLLFVRDFLNHNDAKVTQTYIDTQQLYS